jgi:Spy/CpxP family protein refolding chaperone
METEEKSVRSLRPRARKGLWVGLALLLGAGALSAAVPIAQAQGFGGDGGGPMGEMGPGGGHWGNRMQHLLDKVGASDSQKSQIKAIWDALRPQLQSVHQQHEQLRQQIAQTMTAPTIDTGRIESLRKQSVQLMDKASSLVTQGMVQSAQVLTPDQRKAALAEIQAHHQGHGRFHGPGAGQPPAGQ